MFSGRYLCYNVKGCLWKVFCVVDLSQMGCEADFKIEPQLSRMIAQLYNVMHNILVRVKNQQIVNLSYT